MSRVTNRTFEVHMTASLCIAAMDNESSTPPVVKVLFASETLLLEFIRRQSSAVDLKQS